MIIAAMLLFAVVAAHAQSLAKLVPAGSKVFLLVPGKSNYNTAVDALKGWGQWTIVDNREDADFTMKISMSNKMSSSTASAEINNKKNETIYTTQSVNFMNQEGAIKQLIKKRIIADKN